MPDERPTLPVDKSERAAAKSSALRDAAAASLSFERDGLLVKLGSVWVRADGALGLTVTSAVDLRATPHRALVVPRRAQPFFYVNPPVMVDDAPAGKQRRLRYDTRLALQQLVIDSLRRYR